MTEITKFYLLHALFNIYDKWDIEDIAITSSFPEGFAPITSVAFHMAHSQHNLTRRDIDLVLPSLKYENLILERQGKYEKEYQITVNGMLEYVRLSGLYPHEEIERATHLIQDAERRAEYQSVQAPKADYLNVLYYLYLQYREKNVNKYQFADMFDNYEALPAIEFRLKELGKTPSVYILDVIKYLYVQRFIKLNEHSSEEFMYRITQAGIQYIESELDKKFSPLTVSVQNGKWETKNVKSSQDMKPTVGTAPDFAAAIGVKHSGKFFISHAVKNKAISVAFTEKILETGLRVHQDEVFNISVEGQGIASGEDFKKHIEKEIRTARAIILLITPEYKASGACLNEMGAAWMMEGTIPVIPFILGMSHTEVGFIHNPTQHLQLNVKADLYKFVTELKKLHLIKGDYDNGRLDTKITEFIELLQSINTETKPEPVSESIVAQKAGKKMTAESWGNTKQSATSLQDKAKAIIENSFIPEFKPRERAFYMINQHGNQYYYFENNQFHLVPNIFTAYLLGIKQDDKITHYTISEDDENILIGEPMVDVRDLPKLRTKDDSTLFVLYKKKRHQVVGSQLINVLGDENITYVEQSDLLKIPLGNVFTLPN